MLLPEAASASTRHSVAKHYTALMLRGRRRRCCRHDADVAAAMPAITYNTSCRCAMPLRASADADAPYAAAASQLSPCFSPHADVDAADAPAAADADFLRHAAPLPLLLPAANAATSFASAPAAADVDEYATPRRRCQLPPMIDALPPPLMGAITPYAPAASAKMPHAADYDATLMPPLSPCQEPLRAASPPRCLPRSLIRDIAAIERRRCYAAAALRYAASICCRFRYAMSAMLR